VAAALGVWRRNLLSYARRHIEAPSRAHVYRVTREYGTASALKCSPPTHTQSSGRVPVPQAPTDLPARAARPPLRAFSPVAEQLNNGEARRRDQNVDKLTKTIR